jgi:hypothetical protein
MNHMYGALPRDFSVKVPTFEAAIVDPKALPGPPITVDWTTKVSSWPMYQNNIWGDCTVAGVFHALAAITANSGIVPGGAMFSNAEVLKVYEAVSPGFNPIGDVNDNGATLVSVMQYGIKTGFKDTAGKVHKLAGYAEVGNYTNLALLKSALYTFGSVYMAVNLQQAQENQFSEGLPWSYVPGSPIVGGHCIPMELSSLDDPGVSYNETIITWGAKQKVNRPFLENQLSEAIVFFTEDWIEANGTSPSGLDLTQIIADSHLV